MPVAIPLGLFAACAVLIALSYAYRNSIGAVLEALAHLFIRATWDGPFGVHIGFAFIGHAIQALDNAIRDALTAGITHTEWAWHRMIHATAVAWQDLGNAVDNVSTSTVQALEHLRNVTIPAMVGAALLGPTALLSLLRVQVGQLAAQVGNLAAHPGRTVVKTIQRVQTIEHTVTKVIVRTVPAAVGTAIAPAFPRIGQLEREAGALKHRLGQIARTLTPAGIIGLVGAAVFSQFGLGWLKCSNVKKAGKSVCGMNAHVLEGLLSGLVALFATFSLAEFAKYLQPIVGEIGGDVTHFWRAEIAGQTRDRAVGEPGLTPL